MKFYQVTKDDLTNAARNQCTITAFAGALNVPFEEAFQLCASYAKRRYNGRLQHTEMNKLMRDLGFTRTFLNRKPHGKKLAMAEAAAALQADDVAIVFTSGHALALTQEAVIDTFDSRRRKVKEMWVNRGGWNGSSIYTEPAPEKEGKLSRENAKLGMRVKFWTRTSRSRGQADLRQALTGEIVKLNPVKAVVRQDGTVTRFRVAYAGLEPTAEVIKPRRSASRPAAPKPKLNMNLLREMFPASLKLGDRVRFGRPNGQKRTGRVIKLNKKTVKVQTAEGAIWDTSYSLAKRI